MALRASSRLLKNFGVKGVHILLPQSDLLKIPEDPQTLVLIPDNLEESQRSGYLVSSKIIRLFNIRLLPTPRTQHRQHELK